jgi:glutamate-1-semialdehyde 2,1-aminomutase
MLTPFFTSQPVFDYVSAKRADTTAFGCSFRAFLERGIYFPPSQFEAAFVSAAHTESDITATLQAAASAFQASQVQQSRRPE